MVCESTTAHGAARSDGWGMPQEIGRLRSRGQSAQIIPEGTIPVKPTCDCASRNDSAPDRMKNMKYNQSGISLPAFDAFWALRSRLRAALLKNVEETCEFLPHLQGIGGTWTRRWMELSSLVGSEEFYSIFVPILLVGPFESTTVRSWLFLWCINQYLGSFLKSIFCLPRPAKQFLNSKASKAALNNRDFGWPSTHALNAMSLPWFTLWNVFGVLPLWASMGSSVASVLLHVAVGMLVISISASRLYLGVHSPTDVQGGMVLGGSTLFVWMAVSPAVIGTFETSPVLAIMVGGITGAVLLLALPKTIPESGCYEETFCTLSATLGINIGMTLLEKFNVAPGPREDELNLHTLWRLVLVLAMLLLGKTGSKMILTPLLNIGESSIAFNDEARAQGNRAGFAPSDNFTLRKAIMKFIQYTVGMGMMISFFAPLLSNAIMYKFRS